MTEQMVRQLRRFRGFVADLALMSLRVRMVVLPLIMHTEEQRPLLVEFTL